MLSISTIIVLTLIAALIWAWSSNLKSREVAIKAAKDTCKHHALQLLDGSIHFHKCRPKRNQRGALGIIRFYYFDFFDGNLRQQGRVVILGLEVISIELDSINKDRENSANTTTSTHAQTNNVIQFPSSKKHDT